MKALLVVFFALSEAFLSGLYDGSSGQTSTDPCSSNGDLDLTVKVHDDLDTANYNFLAGSSSYKATLESSSISFVAPYGVVTAIWTGTPTEVYWHCNGLGVKIIPGRLDVRGFEDYTLVTFNGKPTSVDFNPEIRTLEAEYEGITIRAIVNADMIKAQANSASASVQSATCNRVKFEFTGSAYDGPYFDNTMKPTNGQVPNCDQAAVSSQGGIPNPLALDVKLPMLEG